MKKKKKLTPAQELDRKDVITSRFLKEVREANSDNKSIKGLLMGTIGTLGGLVEAEGFLKTEKEICHIMVQLDYMELKGEYHV